MWGKPPLSGDTAPRYEPGTGRDHSRNTPRKGVAWSTPLGRVSREPEGHTRNDPSRAAQGDEHPIGPRWRGLTQPRETPVFSNPGRLEGPGSLCKIPQSERKPDRDLISTRDKIPPEFYPGKLKNLGISPEVLILGKVLRSRKS